ncbi:MAG: NAD-glutamate dehydrogenase, partial [Propionibacteriaceae bacterium]|nr:NAD-glutamate dehydrogenase [Propionibacteriaceae bacterium]
EWTADDRSRFTAAFDAIWRGRAEADQLNHLVMLAGLTWQQVSHLRAIARYLQQAGVPYSQGYVAASLVDNPGIAAALVDAFATRFDPAAGGDRDARQAHFEAASAAIETALGAVTSLDADRILRLCLAVLRAMVRTNAFAPGAPALAFKLRPRELDVLPEPRPLYEIFVASPRVQGVHLRFGPVARGGLRWSDRPEDFRTEVLGLVKAQMVKNTVIVPVGAKGGFVPLNLPDPALDRAAWQAEGVACYQSFVGALLSLTDNIVGDAVVPPEGVLRYDGDDPYLVVAADKGTATFSDIANQIARDRSFWLDDAFASGGSAGYDHKAMGITARGAWESVKRHFAELGVDPHLQDFTCVGIGDMSGDVFGNGMLLSRHTLLVAAFDHRHIFLDPTPDPEEAFNERARLFGIPRSTWADYDESKISVGGGVFSRDAKSIWVSPQARQALSWDGPDVVTPNELISVILRARVDLLWNGGIGTYFKAEHETHADAGDKANDPVRVNGSQVRARCAVEGGNLGWTQAGRVEYAQRGGAINTDFIDNSAGVDTSDYEVNIKILLADAVAAGLLDPAERDELLASMTDEIAVSVLRHNIAQNLALSNAQALAADMAGTHAGWIKALEADGFLDRKLEFLPSGGQIRERMAVGFGLTRPELAVLLAYTKIALKHLVLASELPEDPYLADRLTEYFPAQLRERFAQLLPGHRLAREIITTVAVNRFVDSQGITAFHRLSLETGAGIADVVRAQLAARSIYSVGLAEVLLSRMRELDAALATTLRLELRRMVERATRWLLHNRRAPLDIRAAVAEFAEPVHFLRENLRDILTPAQAQRADARYHKWVAGGAPPELAAQMSVAGYGHFALGIAQVAKRLNLDPAWVGAVHGQVCRVLSLDAMDAQVYALPRKVRWDDMARASVRDELLGAQAELTALAIKEGGVGDPADVVANWIANNPSISERAQMLREIVAEPDLARMSVGLGQIRAILRAE